MSNVIPFILHKEQDPILRKGDLVVLRIDDDMTDADEDDAHEYDGMHGIVIAVRSVYGPETEAPGQACEIDVGIPVDDDEWEEVATHIECVSRVLGLESKRLRGHDV